LISDVNKVAKLTISVLDPRSSKDESNPSPRRYLKHLTTFFPSVLHSPEGSGMLLYSSVGARARIYRRVSPVLLVVKRSAPRFWKICIPLGLPREVYFMTGGFTGVVLCVDGVA
jgi:hypothetical protein